MPMKLMIELFLEWMSTMVNRRLDELELRILNLLADAWVRVRYAADVAVN